MAWRLTKVTHPTAQCPRDDDRDARREFHDANGRPTRDCGLMCRGQDRDATACKKHGIEIRRDDDSSLGVVVARPPSLRPLRWRPLRASSELEEMICLMPSSV